MGDLGVLDTPATKLVPRWPHTPKLSEGLVNHEHRPGGPRARERRPPHESRVVGTPASLLALSKASCAGHFMRRGPGEPGAELGVCPRGSCGGLRDTGHGAPRLGARYAEPGSGHSQTGLRRWEQVRGRSTALAPSGLEHGNSTQCGCTPSWLGAAGPEARVGGRGPHGLAAVPGYAPRLPGYPAEKARRTRGPGPAGSWEAAATVTATVTPEDRCAASWWGRSGSRPLLGATAWRGGRLVAALIASDRPRSTGSGVPWCLISINSSSKELAGDAAPLPLLLRPLVFLRVCQRRKIYEGSSKILVCSRMRQGPVYTL